MSSYGILFLSRQSNTCFYDINDGDAIMNSCMEHIGRQYEHEQTISEMKMEAKGKNLIFYVEGPMPDGLIVLCCMMGLFKE